MMTESDVVVSSSGGHLHHHRGMLMQTPPPRGSGESPINLHLLDHNLQNYHHHMQQQQHQQNHNNLKVQSPSSSNSRILDIPCKVCGDFSSGKHYNIFACDGCAGFFKRSIRRNRQYVCKAKDEGSCTIDKTHRNQCRACRLRKCQSVGMNKDAVQHERGPRNSTLRRQQMCHFFGLAESPSSPPTSTGVVSSGLLQPGGNVINLTVPKESSLTSPKPMSDHLLQQYPGFVPSFIQSSFASAIPHPQLHFAHNVPLPPIFSQHLLTPSAICESAAQLLFMNVQWVRTLTAFTALPIQDQLVLLEESWLDLFVVGAAQFLPLMDLGILIQTSGILRHDPGDPTALLRDVEQFQTTLRRIQQFQLDPHEYACLRAIVLFKNVEGSNGNRSDSDDGDGRRLLITESSKISSIQDDAQMRLNKYISLTYPKQPLRFGKILLMVSSGFRNVAASTIEELFFKKVIRDTPIVAIISNMYKNQFLANSFNNGNKNSTS